MVTRPSIYWREDVEREARELASGAIDPDDAVIAELFPESLLASTDQALSAFECVLKGLADPNDEQLSALLELTTRALNSINTDHGGDAYETDEREQLCAFLEESLVDAGCDLDAFAARNSMTRHQITDRWRAW
ncbi:hypothetical protein [Nocardia sp. AB354]|uniref:hypothetical protein n=1 Tax=Nocardia sp. AB354 TaxID=3413283 RepID=UPI003C19EAA5